MSILAVIFGILSGCFLAVLVGIIGSHRRIGFGWAFLISLIFTPLVGLIVALLTDPLPGGGQRWGCVGTVVAILGLLFFAAFLLLALTGGAMLLALASGRPALRFRDIPQRRFFHRSGRTGRVCPPGRLRRLSTPRRRDLYTAGRTDRGAFDRSADT